MNKYKNEQPARNTQTQLLRRAISTQNSQIQSYNMIQQEFINKYIKNINNMRHLYAPLCTTQNNEIYEKQFGTNNIDSKCSLKTGP